MYQQGRDGGGSQSADPADLAKVLRLGPFEPLDHFIGEAADGAKLKSLGYAEIVVVIYSLGSNLLFLNVSAVHRICECSFEFIHPNLILQFSG